MIAIFRDRSRRSSDSTSAQLTLSWMDGSSSVIRFCVNIPDAPKTKARPIALALDRNLEFRLRFRSSVTQSAEAVSSTSERAGRTDSGERAETAGHHRGVLSTSLPRSLSSPPSLLFATLEPERVG